MTTLLNLFSRFNDEFHLKESELKARLNEMPYRKAELEVIEILKQKGISYPITLEALVYEPIAKEVARAIEADKYEISGPFGISAKSNITWYINNNENPKVLEITFVPEPSNEGGAKLSMVDYSVNTGEYPPGTVGFYNGLNFGSTEIPDDTPINKITPILIEHFKKQKEA